MLWQGDSGGPLMCQRCSSCAWYLAGITSFGPTPCATPGYPGVYTKVLEHELWIDDEVKSVFEEGLWDHDSSCPWSRIICFLLISRFILQTQTCSMYLKTVSSHPVKQCFIPEYMVTEKICILRVLIVDKSICVCLRRWGVIRRSMRKCKWLLIARVCKKWRVNYFDGEILACLRKFCIFLLYCILKSNKIFLVLIQ